MKRKTIILAVVAAAAMALTLVGCGVKITNIAVPEITARMAKGEYYPAGCVRHRRCSGRNS